MYIRREKTHLHFCLPSTTKDWRSNQICFFSSFQNNSCSGSECWVVPEKTAQLRRWDRCKTFHPSLAISCSLSLWKRHRVLHPSQGLTHPLPLSGFLPVDDLVGFTEKLKLSERIAFNFRPSEWQTSGSQFTLLSSLRSWRVPLSCFRASTVTSTQLPAPSHLEQGLCSISCPLSSVD